MSYLTFPKPSVKEFAVAGSEIARYRHLVAPFCGGVGCEIGTQGVGAVPWGVQLDLPLNEALHYSGGHPEKGPIQLRGRSTNLPFDNASLDWVGSCHYLEDELDFLPILSEWCRCIKIGGFIWNIGPEKAKWAAEIKRGRDPNCMHKHELVVGEMTKLFARYYGHFEVIHDELTNVVPKDYSVWFVAKRVR